MSNEELIPGMEKIIQHIKKVQEENRRLKEENQKLRAQARARAQVLVPLEGEALEQRRAVVSFE